MASTYLFALLCNDSLVLDWIARDTVDGKRTVWEVDFYCLLVFYWLLLY